MGLQFSFFREQKSAGLPIHKNAHMYMAIKVNSQKRFLSELDLHFFFFFFLFMDPIKYPVFYSIKSDKTYFVTQYKLYTISRYLRKYQVIGCILGVTTFIFLFIGVMLTIKLFMLRNQATSAPSPRWLQLITETCSRGDLVDM